MILFYLIFLKIFFATLHDLWDLSSLTRDQTSATGSAESKPVDPQGSPHMVFLQGHQCLDLGDTRVHYNFILTSIFITSAKTPLPNEVTFTDRRVRVCTCLVGGQNPATAVCKWFLCPAWEVAHSTCAHTPLAGTQPREPQGGQSVPCAWSGWDRVWGAVSQLSYSKVSEVRRETVVREGGEDSQGCREQRDGARRCPSSGRILHLKAIGYRGTKQ